MNILIPTIMIFAVSVLVIELLFYAVRYIKNPDRARIQKQLKKISAGSWETKLPELMRTRVLSKIPLLNQILMRITMIERLDRLRHQADVRHPSGFFILLALVFAGAGFLGFNMLLKIQPWYLSGVLSLFTGCFPFFYLYSKKNKRMKKFQAQLPEALDLMARSLRAGHAFSTGMKLAGDEFEDPLGSEFSITLDEINFGLGVPEALKNLVKRVDCTDLNFFVVSVILQRETGGNLAEIMQNIAYLIRERYKFHGKVKTLSAEGKLSAVILTLLPFAVGGALFILNKSYMMILFTEHIGKVMCGVAVVLMVIGAFVMRRIVDIEV
ncbi:MAG: type II secretion system F family protein [Thermodesulfobacteriota bacterium]|nr:type II secretion system F family protein [Thermodesulfobacteriota bacterium]